MALFLSTFINKIDKKGRVTMPASFRAALSQSATSLKGELLFSGMVVFRSLKYQALEGCGLDRMQHLSSSIDQLDLFSNTQDDLVSAIFADSQLLSFDGEGRVNIPENFLKFANVNNEIAFVGRGATFQLWNPEVFQKAQEDARTRLKQESLSLHLKGEEKI